MVREQLQRDHREERFEARQSFWHVDHNLAEFVDYLEGRASYIVFTAYPENDQFEGNELSPSEWDVVSHREAPST